MKVLLTGAFGRVGTSVIEHLINDYDFRLLDKRSHSELESTSADVSEYSAFAATASNHDGIVHLAGNPSVEASWPETLTSNILGAYNCFEVARRKKISKVIFASTNHVVGMYEQELAPDLYEPDFNFIIDSSTPIRPDSHYAVSKVYGEAIARYYVESFDYPKQVFIVRIGSVRGPFNDHPYADAENKVALNEITRDSEDYEQAVNRMKATWLSRRDAAHLVDCCLNNNAVEFGIYFGVSENSRRWFEIDSAQNELEYEPKDSADDWHEPPPEGD